MLGILNIELRIYNMPLYLTDRLSEFDIEHNDNANFVYFDSIRKDNNNIATLMLRDKDNGVPIIYRSNMSDLGRWTIDEFKSRNGKVNCNQEFNDCMHKLNLLLIENKLVVFPMQSFNVVLHSMDDGIANIYRSRIEYVIKHSGLKRDYVSHALSFKL
jgi:hypothetical protein